MNSDRIYEPPATKLPASFLVARLIGDKHSQRMLRVLFDSGGSCTWISSRALPRGCIPDVLDKPTNSMTLAGAVSTNQFVVMHEISLPEFDRNKKIDKHGAFVFDGPCNYDLILGRDFLERIGFKLDFDQLKMRWINKEIDMKDELPPETVDKYRGTSSPTSANTQDLLDGEIVDEDEFLRKFTWRFWNRNTRR
ncbi:MAG: retropepsin-like aspartic protease [Nodosilinea sp.]